MKFLSRPLVNQSMKDVFKLNCSKSNEGIAKSGQLYTYSTYLCKIDFH